jgi:hypothetical protein
MLVSAIGIDNPNLPIVKPAPTSFPTNTTINVSVNSSRYWDTSDRGPLGAVSSLMHNWLGGLQGGTSGEYYHITGAQSSYLNSNLYNFLTGANISYIATNINHSDLLELGWSSAGHYIDTTVDFNNHSLLNVSVLNVTTINAKDIFLSNNTLYIGDTITLSASGAQGSVLNISGGNVTVGNDGYYFGSGKFLTDLNLTNISFAGDTINASQFNGNFTGNFFGVYNWIAQAPLLNFNGTLLTFNDTYLRNQTEVNLQIYSTNITTSGGSGSATTSLLDFEIKQITVTPTSLTSKYRFQMTEGGNYIDKDRTLHTGVWDIEKSYAINSTATINITSSNPAVETYSVNIKYLSNWN